MQKFGKSQPASRLEDVRFLTGHGRYLDDTPPEEALRVYFLRSPMAHATIASIDLEAAKEAPGVHLVLDGEGLREAGVTEGLAAVTVDNRDGSKGAAPRRPLLAEGRVRFVGEAVAMVVADTLQEARDAAELIEVDYEDLPVHMALAAGGEPLHEDVPENRAFDWALGDEEGTEKAIAEAAHVVRLSVGDNRIISNPMEPRGAWADMEDGRLHLSFGGQGVWNTKRNGAKIYGLEPEEIRVTIPDVGGGFGTKAPDYPETYLVGQAARMLERPVRWYADRSETMLSDNAGRDLEHDLTLAFDDDLKITAYRVETRCNMGAYNSGLNQPIQTVLFSKVLTGVFDIQTAYQHVEGFYTNTTQVDAYRGAGRPEAIYALERVMDRAARELGVDTWELHRRNFIKPDQFPYTSFTGETYDVGEFARLLAKAEEAADRDGFAARKAESEGQGRLRGMGLCYYIEAILGNPTETAKVEFHEDGTVSIYVGTQSNGQGHETAYARFLSDQTGIPVENIRVVQGDSDKVATGGGTGGSRSVTTQNNATLATVSKMVEAFTPYLAEKMGVAPEDVAFDDETFRAPGSNLTPTFVEAAEMARVDGRTDLLVHEETATLPGRSYPNGAHVAEVEVDPETGHVTLERYTVVDDFGNLINPMLAEGQVHGGSVQGIGQALWEHVGYDEDGQLLTGSFMDYAMPRADDVPMIGFTSEPVPSTANAMGMKGCGEAGTVGAMAATANAVADALWQRGVRQADMPFTPSRVWKMLNDAMDTVG
ncbi:xanthine dehydrogenase family protein molybdopterin-binding subunit [Roseovarius indicus]|uniref:Carbon monoxide dehydrogenase large chain n=1 Tax=Roseovarius indicus TaxID=540747 RepID=A0A0T5P4F2_9RHOB|nr:xanthine dehydrogenase family protein molybdopterin-binding subunit [Roseovarius indicus]KRS15940.1 xanthine dehydrogenase [Roseovarius indicus]QEW27939.1 Carbon monoxide dehydrogenase large chain [Roseovarius indicus]SFE58173.1 carbon-monoxide dehydrogenase large subunit [Roseovarius indicus]